MNIRQLEHVMAIAETRSIRKAAERVHLTQPALTRSLQSLEEQLGTSLFDRSHAEVTPNSFGIEFMKRATRILGEVRDLDRSIREMKGLDEGSLRLGLGPFVAEILTTNVVEPILQKHPRLRITIEVTGANTLLEMIERDLLDIYVADVRTILPRHQVTVEPLPQLPVAYMVRAGHPLAQQRGRIPIAQVHRYPLGIAELPPSLAVKLHEEGGSDGPTLRCNDVTSLKRLALTTDIVIFLPLTVAPTELSAGQLVVIDTVSALMGRTQVGIVSMKHRSLGPAARVFADLTQKELAMRAEHVKRWHKHTGKA